jgi:hypothetical protein
MNPQLKSALRDYQTGYYQEKLDQGLEFQDYVTEEMYKIGWPIVGYSSKKFQITRGENIMGAEIKNDQRFRETGNLYIEMEEKAHPTNPHYVKSGIMREDNSIIFIIGDRDDFWIMAIRFLRQLAEVRDKIGCYHYDRVRKPTSKGFLFPVKDADRYCIHKVSTLKDADATAASVMPW